MRWTLVVALGAALAAFACDDPDESDSPAVVWCDAVCSSAKRCGYFNPSCSSDCVAERPTLMEISLNGAKELAPCLERLSCSALASETQWSSEMEACWARARRGLSPTESVRKFCEDYTAEGFRCGYVLPIDECDSIYGMWSDAVLDRVLACRQPSCETFDACVEGVFTQ